MPEVIVVGAGPVGLLLTAELRRRGVDTLTLERRAEAGDGTRAIGLHPPTLTALEASGVTERLLEHAVRVGRGEARSEGRLIGAVDFGTLDTRFPFVATLPQRATEAALTAAAGAVERDRTVTRITPEGERMRVRLDGGDDVTARIVVVATGGAGRALVFRPEALSAHEYPDQYLMTDTAVTSPHPVAVIHLDAAGVMESFPLPGSERRFVLHDPEPAHDDPRARRERMRRALVARGAPDAAESLGAVTGFRVRRLVAPRLRRGALFAIGDAAHEVSPIGGQGMNLGLLDAASLAPLLAEWVRTGTPPDAELARWEQRRVRSARIAAGIASLNTVLGRPAGRLGHAARSLALRATLAGPTGRVLTRAYAMGFDTSPSR